MHQQGKFAVTNYSERRVPGVMAGPAINPVQGFRTLQDIHWEFLRLWTGFELSSSWIALPSLAMDQIENEIF
jgi:hypothetical protein